MPNYRGLDLGSGFAKFGDVLDQGYRDRAALQAQQDTAMRQMKMAEMQDARAREMQQLGFEQQNALQDKKLASDLKVAGVTAGNKQGQKNVTNSAELRKEFNQIPVVKQFPEVQRSFMGMQDAMKNPTAGSDMRSIFLLMKMYDPNSTVREGEYATAQKATGVPGQIMNIYNATLSGQKLTPEQRQDFLNQAHGMYKNAATQYQDYRAQYAGIAQKVGADPEIAAPNMDFVERSNAAPAVSNKPAAPAKVPTAADYRAFAAKKLQDGGDPKEITSWLNSKLQSVEKNEATGSY
jgi:hypothetical protein